MDRFKLIGLLALPALISVAPGPWVVIPPQQPGSTTELCRIADPRINECSGLAIARSTRNAVWVHNDSGDSPRVFLVGLDGKTKTEVTLKGAKATDWEDICSFSLDDRNWLLIGDVGDNQKDRATRREKARLYLVEEPGLPATKRKKLTVEPERTIKFEYEDGPHDCEGIAVDTASRQVLLIAKSLFPTDCHLYALPLDSGKKKPVAIKIADLPVPVVTGMDLSPDGRTLVVITPLVGFLVKRAPQESWADAVRRAPRAIQLPKAPQTEAVCFGRDGRSLFVTSEGLERPIWKINLDTSPLKPGRRRQRESCECFNATGRSLTLLMETGPNHLPAGSPNLGAMVAAVGLFPVPAGAGARAR